MLSLLPLAPHPRPGEPSPQVNPVLPAQPRANCWSTQNASLLSKAPSSKPLSFRSTFNSVNIFSQ